MDLNYGKALVEKNRRPGKVPVYGTNGQCGWHDEPLAAGPGVILGRKGMGNLGVEWCEGNFWVIDTAYYVTPKIEDLDLKFFYYLIDYIGLNHLKDGTSNPSLSRDTFAAQLIPWPPLATQRAIAQILSSLDDKIELNRRMNETLEGMAQSIFKSWFVDFDPVRAKVAGRQPAGMDADTAALFPDQLDVVDSGDIPTGWKRGALQELQGDEQYAITAGPFGSNLTRQDYASSGVPVIRGSNMAASNGWFDESDFVFVSPAKAASLRANQARPGDVLFTQRGTLGQVSLIPTCSHYPTYIISQSQMKMTCASWVPPEYVFLNFKLPSVIEYIAANATATGVPHINLSFLRQFPILIPFRKVLERFARVIGPIFQTITERARENTMLAAMRDALLPKLLSGAIRVGDGK